MTDRKSESDALQEIRELEGAFDELVDRLLTNRLVWQKGLVRPRALQLAKHIQGSGRDLEERLITEKHSCDTPLLSSAATTAARILPKRADMSIEDVIKAVTDILEDDSTYRDEAESMARELVRGFEQRVKNRKQ